MAEKIKTHLIGLRWSPQAFAAILKILACLLRTKRCFMEEPKSSAHTLVADSFWLSQRIMNNSTIGFTPKRKRIELSGHPVLTPLKIANKRDPSPTPEE